MRQKNQGRIERHQMSFMKELTRYPLIKKIYPQDAFQFPGPFDREIVHFSETATVWLLMPLKNMQQYRITLPKERIIFL